MSDDKNESEVTGPPDQFIGRDLLESYMYYRNYMPSNPIESYIVEKKCIEFGKEIGYYGLCSKCSEEHIRGKSNLKESEKE